MNLVESRVLSTMLGKKFILADHAKGVYIYDADGNAYLDGCGSAFTVTIGHAEPSVVAELHEQLQRLHFLNYKHFANAPAEQLAELVLRKVGKNYSRVYFSNSGSEAVEAAIKLARQYQRDRGEVRRYKVISLGAYNGVTLGALALTPGMMQTAGGWEPMVGQFARPVTPINCQHCPWSLQFPDCNVLCAGEIERCILREGPESIAAVITESKFNSGEAEATYWKMLRSVCDKYGVLLITDEVLTGFGRTGKVFAYQHWDVEPDIIAFGKTISSGYAPLSGLIVRDHIVETLKRSSKTFMHGQTFSAHPFCCSAGVAVQNFMEENDLYARVLPIGNYIKTVIDPIFDEHMDVVARSHSGLLFNYFVKLNGSQVGRSNPVYERIEKILFKNRLIIWHDTFPNVIRFALAPQYITNDEHVHELGHKLNCVLPRCFQASRFVN